MSNQLQITGGAKVRNLEGVITGTSGVLGALPINTASGIPQLDSNGKILVSQLPNSVMEFLGVWNASTNTPYLHDGTGNAGDVYLCNVAGTVNFGSGPITFSVGDYVVYTGSVWARSSGATGTVTSVAVSESSAALNITGSPITTSGTINIGFAGTSAQYVAGDGSLITFPSLTGYVPYTGATGDVNLGLHDLYTSKVWLYDNPNSAYGSMELTDGVLHFEDADGHSMVTMEDGYMTIANASTIRALLNVSGLTSNRDYAFPNASGTLALTSDLSAYVPTSRTISTTSPLQGGGDLSANRTLSILQSSSTQSGYLSSTDWNTFNNKETSLSFYSPLRRSGSSITIDQSNTTTNGYLSSTDWNTFNGKQGTITLTTTGSSGASTFVSNTLNVPTYTLAGLGGQPQLSGTGFVKASGTTISYDNSTYVTTDTTQTITGNKTFSGSLISETGLIFKQQTGFGIANNGYSNFNAFGTELYYSIGTGASTYKFFSLQASGLTNNTLRTYTLPDANGTLALTSDIPSLSGYVQGTGNTNYLPKFTGTSTIGNSILQDDGTNVSIGYTTNPSLYKLDVNGTGRFSGRLNADGNIRAAYLDYVPSGVETFIIGKASYNVFDGNQLAIGTFTALPIEFATNNVKRLTIASTGAATFSSSVTATSFAVGEMSFTSNQIYRNSANEMYVNYSGTGNTIVGNGTGNVSINAGTTPTYRLQVGGTLGVTGAATFSSSVTAGGNYNLPFQGALWWNDDGSSNTSRRRWAIASNYDTYGSLSFKVGTSAGSEPLSGTTVMNITNGGNLLVGTTTDNGAKLQVNGTITTQGQAWKINSAYAGTPAIGGNVLEISVNGTTYYIQLYTTTI